ncbi:MAG: hypothetical protein U0931_38900 [Vulcanimicrobiota bacterium]
MIRLLCTVTGAREDELRQVLYSFSALFFLLLSYYVIKPLRNSQFLSDFDPNYLPVLMLVVPLISFVVTKVFNFFCDRMDKFQVIVRTYILLMGIKIAFTWILQYGGKPGTVLFYFFGSVYFLLALPTLWGCINDFFLPEQGERVFGFVQLGATIGGIAGSKVSGWIADSAALGPYATIFSAGGMGIALFFLILAAGLRRPRPSDAAAAARVKEKVKGAFWSDVMGLIKLRYVRSIAIMVSCLACFTTSLDFLSQTVIDRRMSHKQYEETFPEVSTRMGEEGYKFFYGLKSMPREKVDQALDDFAMKNDVHDCRERYVDYKKSLEKRMRRIFSDVSFYQGVVGFVLLTMVARHIFARLGLKVAVSLLPAFALIAVVAFAFPIEILTVEILLVLSGSLNYALNNATKEILYSATTEETKFKHKPLIEGPFMRLGDQTASIMKLCTGVLAVTMAWNADAGDRIFLAFTFSLVLIWWQAILYAGRVYDQNREAERKGAPVDGVGPEIDSSGAIIE